MIRLKGVTEIAVDLEAHQYRSYLGFTCLMQVTMSPTENFFQATSLLLGAGAAHCHALTLCLTVVYRGFAH
jgi:exosome complex exonuclease RRP6